MAELSGILTPRRRLLLKLAVVGGVVFALPVVGFLTNKSTTFPMLVLVAAVAPIGLHFLLQHIELGLVAMLLAGAFVRFRLPTGTASEIVMSFLLCGGVLGMWVLHMVIVEKRVKLRSMPTNLPIFAFVLTVFVSMAWGRIYRDPLVNNLGSPFVAIVSAMVIVLLPATFVLVANLVTDERWLQAMVWIFVGGGAVSLFFSLIVDLGIGPYHTIRSLVWYNGLVWINTHGLFSLWYVALSLSLALFNRRLPRFLRVALLVHAAGWLYWGFPLRITWLSGWVPAFTTVIVIVFFRSKKMFVLLTLVAVLGIGKFYLQTALESESEESGHTRLAAYEVNWRITGKHLILGTGPAGYAAYYMTYFPMEGMATHNNYIDIIAQTGIVGSVFFLWFLFAHIRGSRQIRRTLQGRGDFAESLAVASLAGTVGCVVAMALGDWLFPFAYTQGIIGFDSALFNWFFMGSIWALRFSMDLETSTSNGLVKQGATT